MKLKDMTLGILVVSIVAIFIVPIETWVMDFLLMISLGVAIIMLLDALYSKEALDMSFFPTILLLVTIFKLSLNLASTKLILGKGYAGEVVAAFGKFVAGDNVVLGIIIFFILVFVNFMVITKGSERVSEVTARFTLDAMPGKQMAIDADLNSGLIDEDEAKTRRKKIQDEANFYGAMDGASKFVKNDAIAGIVITFVNLAGGIIMGVTGMTDNGAALSFGDAAKVYSIMTIGDGLVSQIPSLCISTATGILVTKANSSGDISEALGKQLFGQPVVLLLCGAVMILFGIFTPMPLYMFVPFGGILIYAGMFMRERDSIAYVSDEIASIDDEAEEVRRPENAFSLLGVDPILLVFGYGLIPLVDVSQGGDVMDRIVMIRRQIALELGAIVPIIRLRDDIKLSPNEYKIMIKGVEVAGGEILFDHYMAMNPGYVEEEIDGIETVEPYLGLPALWINESQRERAEALGYTVVDSPAIIATHLTEVVRDNLHELLSRQDVQLLINNIKETNPVLIDELVPKLMSIGDVQKVLANLLKEGISIRDLVTILETLADHAIATRDIDLLTEYVRQSLRRSISQKFFDNDTNTVITLDPELEQDIMSNIQTTEQGSYIALDPGKTQRIFDNLNSQVSKLTSMGLQPIILTSPIVRIYFKRLVEQTIPELVVLSYNELEPTTDIQSIGMVSV